MTEQSVSVEVPALAQSVATKNPSPKAEPVAQQRAVQDGSARGNQRSRQRDQERRPAASGRPRKRIVTKISLQSDSMNDYMYQSRDDVERATSSIAALIQLTADNNEVRERLNQWLEAEFAEVGRKIEQLSIARAAEEEEAGANSANIVVDVPEQYTIALNVTHPLYWRIIDAVTRIDREASAIENLWLAGFVTPAKARQFKGAAMNAIRRLIGRMRNVGTASSNRRGGIFNQRDFEALMASIRRATGAQEFEGAEQNSAPDAAESVAAEPEQEVAVVSETKQKKSA